MAEEREPRPSAQRTGFRSPRGSDDRRRSSRDYARLRGTIQNRRVTLEAPDGAVDAEEQLPKKLGRSGDGLQPVQAAARMVTAKHDQRPGENDERPADHPEPRHPARNEA